MPAQLAALEPEITRFESTIEAIEDEGVILETTYFYAESGGQPADRGTIGGRAVLDVRKTGGSTIHELEDVSGLSVGDTVEASVDENFRTWCRCAHSASHVVYGAGRRLFDELGYGGFDIGTRKVRMDLETPSPIDDKGLIELERLANRVVWEHRPITWESIPVESAHERPEVAFNTKTETTAMADESTVRIVTVGPPETTTADSENGWWDVAACGGTHVRNTRAIGPIAVMGRSNPGEGLTRVELTVGPEAVDRWTTVRTAATEAASTLDAPIDGLPEAVDRLATELTTKTDQLDAATNQLVDLQLDRLRAMAFSKDGHQWVVGAISGADADAVADGARTVLEDGADVVVLLTDAATPTACVASNADVAASTIIEQLTAEFGGGGGGSDRFAQGGGFSATASEIVEYVRE